MRELFRTGDLHTFVLIAAPNRLSGAGLTFVGIRVPLRSFGRAFIAKFLLSIEAVAKFTGLASIGCFVVNRSI
jgi:hypothetical protein